MAVQTKITAEEFLKLPETSQRMELIDGEIIVAPAPRISHQNTIYSAAKTVEQAAPHGKVHLSPTDVYLDEFDVVQPGLMWNSRESQCVQVGDAYFRGAPDLVIEVLSPSTALRDKGAKFRLYEKHGVGEYWMADAVAKYVEVWRRDGDKFVRYGVFGAGETFVSVVLGEKTINVDAIFGSNS